MFLMHFVSIHSCFYLYFLCEFFDSSPTSFNCPFYLSLEEIRGNSLERKKARVGKIHLGRSKTLDLEYIYECWRSEFVTYFDFLATFIIPCLSSIGSDDSCKDYDMKGVTIMKLLRRWRVWFLWWRMWLRIFFYF